MMGSNGRGTLTLSGRKRAGPMPIQKRTKQDIEKMRAAGRVVRKVLEHARAMCRPGTTTREIDDEALRVIQAEGARGLFKDYPSYNKPGDPKNSPSNL